jgi:hypothetical protein
MSRESSGRKTTSRSNPLESGRDWKYRKTFELKNQCIAPLGHAQSRWLLAQRQQGDDERTIRLQRWKLKGSRGSRSAEPTDIEHKDVITLLLVPRDKKNSDQSPLRRRGGCHRRATSRIPSLGSEEQRSRQAFSRLVSTHRYLSKLLDSKKK